MSGPLHVSNLKCYQGVDLTETRLFFNPPASGSTDVQALVPYDFTGATARMMIRAAQDPSSTQYLSLTIGSGLAWTSQTFSPGPAQPAYNNGFVITITKAQSLAMNSGVPFTGGYYDVLVDLPGGTTVCAMAGQFDLVATVTR